MENQLKLKLINLFSYSFQGAEDIFNHLIRSPSIAYPPERIASAMELIGTNVCTPCIITHIELYHLPLILLVTQIQSFILQ